MRPGEEIPPLRHTPGAGAQQRYADVSGDHNPIHLDAEAARAAGLPAPILHGLYTMALVARCACQAAGGRELRSLSVDFRAPGLAGEEIEIAGTVEEASGGHLALRLVARQGRRRLVRRGRATFG